MEEELNQEIQFEDVPPLEFIYEQVSVEAVIEKEIRTENGKYKKQKIRRTLLKECSGKFEPGTMTAILGPSGSGKTTMLNLLSGRLLSKNLTLRGRIRINGEVIESMSDFKSSIGYVMQEDVMLPTFTPRETFRFITDMRLSHKTSEEKDALVESMIVSLGLKRCAETYVGNALIRGISGGERKRTSVGVELLINPSLIFLDEPTTGLDSTTSLNLIKFLNRLASKGRTVVTTIHQPSSEIFLSFDMILLVLDGNVVYHNHAMESMAYFAKLGMPVPKNTNPMDHYMKLMNKEGIQLRYADEGREVSDEDIKKEFDERIVLLANSHNEHATFPKSEVSVKIAKKSGNEANWLQQMLLISKRSMLNELRNPLGIRSKVFQMIFFGVVTIIIYEKSSSDLNSYIQNTAGLIFFMVLNVCFSGVFNSINIFSQERPVFIRERLSNTYQTSSYFVGRSLAYLPLEVFLPFLMIVICYFAVNLDNSGRSFIITLGASWLATWMASAWGLLLSTALASAELANSMVPVLVIPLMLVGGYYAPLQNVHDFYRTFEYISVFKYLYQTMVYAQFNNDRDGFTMTFDGVEQTYEGDIMAKGSQFYFDEPFWLSMFLMGIIGLVIRLISLYALNVISNPQRIKLKDPLEPSSIETNKGGNSAKLITPANGDQSEAVIKDPANM